MRAFLLACACLSAGAAEHTAPPMAPKPLPTASADAVAALPALPRQRALPATEAVGEELVPGIRRQRGQFVSLDGVVNIDQGPVDGLEVVACLKDGKTHEALLRLDTTIGQLVKAACIDGLGLTADGIPAEESSGIPARGVPVRLEVQWKAEDGTWVGADASCLVRDRVTDRGYPPLPFIYTGSRFLVLRGQGPDGKPAQRQQFMLDSTKSVAVAFDEPDALLASPFPGAGLDARFEANSALCPPAGTRIHLVIRPAQLPLTLAQDANGQLSLEGAPLDDAALGKVLAGTFAATASPALRALAVLVDPASDRRHDVATRTRILTQAAQAKAWVVPVFVPR